MGAVIHIVDSDSMINFSVLKNFMKFSGGSLIGAVFDYVMTLLIHATSPLSPSQALALAMIASASLVFLYHEHVTFRTAGAGWLRRYLRFMVLAAVILALRVLLLETLEMTQLAVPLSVAIAIGVVSVINFGVSALFVFPRETND